MDTNTDLLPEPLKVALSDAQDVFIGELTTLICAPEGCAILADWMVSELGVKPWVAKLTVRAIAQGLTLGSRALGKKGLEVVATRLMALPFIDKLMETIGSLAAAVAGGQIKSHADLARFLAGDGKAVDLYVDPGLKVDLRLQIRQIQELEGLRADMGQASEALVALAQNLADQNVLPLDWPRASSTNYLYFGSAQIPFFGREQELDDLQAWLEDPTSAVGWRLVHGEGGHGKSRLALELCERNTHLWTTGFLSREAHVANPDAWRPVEPTLIVIDYAALDPERVRSLILTLGRHAHQFDFPVRVLLLERGGEEDRWYANRFLSGSNLEDENLKALCTATPLALGPLGPDALWDLMTKVAEDPSKLGAPDDAFEILGRIDPGFRALFAVLVATQLGANAEVGSLDRSTLIDNLLRHERQKIWRPYVSDMTEASFGAHLNLLGLATFIGRVSLERVWALRHPALPLEAEYDPGLMRRMCGRECEQDVWPLEPDLVGERFLLTRLAETTPPRLTSRPFISTVFSPPLAIEDWFYAAQVLDRLAMDYPADTIGLLRLPSPETIVEAARLPLAAGFMSALGKLPAEYADKGYDVYKDLKAFAGDAPALKREAAKAGFNLLTVNREIAFDTALGLYYDLKEFAGEEPVLKAEASRGATNLLDKWPYDRIDEGRAFYEEHKAFAGDSPELMLDAARSGFNLFNNYLDTDHEAAWSIYEDLKVFGGEDPERRLKAAEAGFNLVSELRKIDVDAARAAFEDVKAYAGDDPAMKQQVAKAATNLFEIWPSDQIAEGQQIYEELKIFAGDAPDLLLEVAQSGTNLLGSWPATNFDGARALYNDLKVLAGEDLRLRFEAAKAGVNLLGSWLTTQPEACPELSADIRQHAGDDPAAQLVAGYGGLVMAVQRNDEGIWKENMDLLRQALMKADELGPTYELTGSILEAWRPIAAFLDAGRGSGAQTPPPA